VRAPTIRIAQSRTDEFRGAGPSPSRHVHKDRWGFSWQITPRVLLNALDNPDAAAAKRAFDAMMPMTKIDIATIEAALRGEPVDA
jgi:hypothetical protein